MCQMFGFKLSEACPKSEHWSRMSVTASSSRLLGIGDLFTLDSHAPHHVPQRILKIADVSFPPYLDTPIVEA